MKARVQFCTITTLLQRLVWWNLISTVHHWTQVQVWWLGRRWQKRESTIRAMGCLTLLQEWELQRETVRVESSLIWFCWEVDPVRIRYSGGIYLRVWTVSGPCLWKISGIGRLTLYLKPSNRAWGWEGNLGLWVSFLGLEYLLGASFVAYCGHPGASCNFAFPHQTLTKSGIWGKITSIWLKSSSQLKCLLK